MLYTIFLFHNSWDQNKRWAVIKAWSSHPRGCFLPSNGSPNLRGCFLPAWESAIYVVFRSTWDVVRSIIRNIKRFSFNRALLSMWSNTAYCVEKSVKRNMENQRRERKKKKIESSWESWERIWENVLYSLCIQT
jgi:hypothetical protein